ncbi:hypothetical protein HYW84_04190 [Candidatus Peregrinibacteria bacterium]|nr:hypothetical protein [Candidatus Peregrinibacteria bacterium]
MRYHLIVYVPLADAQKIRDVLAANGAGKIGNYDSCSFSTRGTGRFRPLKGSDPFIGKNGEIAEVEEERIEAVVSGIVLKKVLKAVRKAHPYEEPAIHVLPMRSV